MADFALGYVVIFDSHELPASSAMLAKNPVSSFNFNFSPDAPLVKVDGNARKRSEESQYNSAPRASPGRDECKAPPKWGG